MNKVPAMKLMFPFADKWHYSSDIHKRDLRIDFIRGFVMLFLIVVHIDMISFYDYLAWERIGAVTGAEGFVIISGLILGFLSRLRINHDGFMSMAGKQFNRSFLLYKTSIVVILSIIIIDLIPFIDASVTMNFTMYGEHGVKIYSLYPNWDSFLHNYNRVIAKFLILRYGPHQFQILGLYVFLLMLSPFILWFISRGKIGIVLTLSWIAYFVNNGFNLRITGAQFEYAFPLMVWQLLFVHGLVIGYYRNEIWNFFHSRKGAWVFALILLLFVVFLFFTYNSPIKEIPAYLRLNVISPETFRFIHDKFFTKNTLGIGRLVNDFVVLFVSYAMLSYFWKPIYKFFGWFFVPIGQASLYVFILHVYICILIANITFFHQGNIYINTLGHTLVLAILWLMVRYKVAYKWIPR